MADIAALQEDCVVAETAKAELIATRASKREELSKTAFRQYNESTRSEQLAVTESLRAANEAFTAALNEVRSDAVTQVVNVGTLEEGNQIGQVS